MRKVTTQLSDDEYGFMRREKSGYGWNQLIRTGYHTLMNEHNALAKISHLESEVLRLAAKVEVLNRRTARIQEENWKGLRKAG